jgi:hypothetical protein
MDARYTALPPEHAVNLIRGRKVGRKHDREFARQHPEPATADCIIASPSSVESP